MANKTIYTRIVVWSQTKTEWGTIDDILLRGEFGLEFPDSVSEGSVATPKIKVGDGIHAFKDLPYATMTPEEVNAKIENIVSQTAHTHDNKDILDAITAAFTTELKAKYDAKVDTVKIDGVEQTVTNGEVNLPAYPTKSSLGMDKVDNTADSEKAVLSATKLATARNIELSGDATGSVSFDGTKDVNINVTVENDSHTHSNESITSLDASKITTGVIDIERLPKGALERCVVVANDTARFALTTNDVQLGDTVKVTDSGKMYFVVDASKLSTEAGYEVYTAGSATSVPWSGVTDKPTEFNPTAHTHTMSEITDYVEPEVDTELDVNSTNAVENKAIATKFAEIDSKLADIMYEAINITSFTNNVNTVEMGSTVAAITFNWNYNKVPKTLTLDGQTLTPSLKTTSLNGLSITANKTYTLKATDDRDAVSQKTSGITFLNGVYYGAKPEPTDYDSAFILGLTKNLQGSKGKTFTVTAGTNDYIYYAVPTRYGACGFNVGGFDGGFSKVKTISFTNASGYTENYDIYKSNNANLGNTTVKVS